VIEFVEAEKCCAGCKKTSQNLKLCSRCSSILYCSKECQCSHWPQHKLVCNKHEWVWPNFTRRRLDPIKKISVWTW
jgi:hypothetical protein